MPDRHLWTRHSTKQIAFDGSAGNGAVGTVLVLTITGRVIVHALTAFCTEDLVSAGAGTVECGTPTTSTDFIAQTLATLIDVNEWWMDATPVAGSTLIKLPASSADGAGAAQAFKALSDNIILTIATGDITDGTVVIDVIYTPLTDGGRLF